MSHLHTPLPTPQVRQVPVLIIGTGISGLYTALKLAEGGAKVLLVTKASLFENNSRYAQGGIAAVLPQNTEDSLELHIQDTLKAGAGLCDEAMTRFILSQGFDAIMDLLRLGVPFDTNPHGDLAVTLEAGHSIQRIIHAGGDATGASVEMALIEQVSASPNIDVIEYAQAVSLHTQNNQVQGALVISQSTQTLYDIRSQFTILATGGLGRLFSFSTNPVGSTGDGFSLAYQAGALLKDMEFIQFHPTAFYHENQVHFLVSEVLRGEGGILRNAEGTAFATQYHPKGELAPRDIVSRAIFFEMQKSLPLQPQKHQSHVYLDITHLPAKQIESRFPTILKNCLAFGIDIRTQWIPVAPAAHYMMGGVSVDKNAKSSVERLFVVGETAHTGLHGANRLASNSLLECVVLARQAAKTIIETLPTVPLPGKSLPEVGDLFYPTDAETEDSISALLRDLHQAMWAHASLVRHIEGLQSLQHTIKQLHVRFEAAGFQTCFPLGIELKNQLTLAKLITESALGRKESLGAHFRSDFPQSAQNPVHSTIQKQTEMLSPPPHKTLVESV